jgi:peptide deformylase
MKFSSLIPALFLCSSSALSTVRKALTSQRKDPSLTRLSMERRDAIESLIISSLAATCVLMGASPVEAVDEDMIFPSKLGNYVYSDSWTGTNLKLLSYEQAASLSGDQLSSTYAMGRWPDPILRRAASPLPLEIMKSKGENYIPDIANALRRTARKNGAVGLAAQQCGIDVSMIFLDDPKLLSKKNVFNGKDINKGGMFVINPRITARSSELEMKVWNEECLVLPPTFRATVLRDAIVKVQYENLVGETLEIQLTDELARALQHELDHDR